MRRDNKNYQVFIEEMPTYLKLISEIFKNTYKKDITFNYDDILEMEKIYLDFCENNNSNIEKLRRAFKAYVGEAIIKYGGGEWDVNLKKDTIYYGEPRISNWGKSTGYARPPIPPLAWIELLEKEKKAGVISDLIKRIKK